MNTQEILLETGLDFNISKRPLFDISQDEHYSSGFYGLFNDNINKCLGIVRNDYRVSQNKDIVDLTLAGLKEIDANISVQYGGAIQDGKKVFLQLAIEGESNVNGDTIKKYITITDSNDGSSTLKVGFGDLTMSCQNQFFKFHKLGQSSLRHNSSLEEKMKEIPTLIKYNMVKVFKQIELYNKLLSTSLHKDLAHQLVKELLGFDKKFTPKEELSLLSKRSLNKMEKVYECIDTEVSSKGKNLWGLHSGITRFTTHELSKPKRTNGDIESLMYGTGYRYNEKSLEFCTQLS